MFRTKLRLALALALGLMPAPAALAEELTGLTELVERWLASPHGDYGSLSFTYWNEEGEVPVACAHCHSEPSFVAWLGADGSAPGVVEHPGAINSPIGCASCHTSAAHALDAVSFPSGVEVAGLGANAVCSVCHQGRQSTDQVLQAVEGIDPDAVSGDLSFLNIHYGVAAAVMHGSDVRGGFQYPGRDYAGRFRHVPGADTCVACHDPHSTQVEVDGCLSCHRGVEDIRAIRTRHTDFDGDGDIAGGIHAEVMGLQGQLYDAIRVYAAEVAGAPIVYFPGRFPYYFNDPAGAGEIAAEDAIFPNRYQNWTPRLLQAAYNYQVAKKDPGGYVHNPAYLLQLLHDSLESLSEQVEIDMGRLRRP
ncbi:polyheme membrane-associated cytochrome C [Pararhodobacter sp. SW119]|uniref:polyheme membrane-associated cytochrome C n=1 Tax=Pararhodobacter sp. SW119 TaxID=2780075 RepID=UPI001ADF431C|nr:polyheme membrane-associated cytochrome C [Pararhodobacter sp. SW119]